MIREPLWSGTSVHATWPSSAKRPFALLGSSPPPCSLNVPSPASNTHLLPAPPNTRMSPWTLRRRHLPLDLPAPPRRLSPQWTPVAMRPHGHRWGRDAGDKPEYPQRTPGPLHTGLHHRCQLLHAKSPTSPHLKHHRTPQVTSLFPPESALPHG